MSVLCCGVSPWLVRVSQQERLQRRGPVDPPSRRCCFVTQCGRCARVSSDSRHRFAVQDSARWTNFVPAIRVMGVVSEAGGGGGGVLLQPSSTDAAHSSTSSTSCLVDASLSVSQGSSSGS